MDLALIDKVVVITGAGGGIGFESACAFHAEGAFVVGGDLDPSALSTLHDPARVVPVRVDMGSATGAEHLVQMALDRFGRVDVLFNNAGVAPVRLGFMDSSDDQWRATFEVNLLGYVRASRAVLPVMCQQRSGVLIHNASESARMPNPRLPDYSASKAAIALMSKSIAQEYARFGIRSNVVAPGFIRTPLFDRPGGVADSLSQEWGVDKEEALRRYVEGNRIPLGRLGTPSEVANTVIFLASERAEFITGTTVTIDGGTTPVV